MAQLNDPEAIRRLLMKHDYELSALVADYDDGRHGAMAKTVLGTDPYTKFEH